MLTGDCVVLSRFCAWIRPGEENSMELMRSQANHGVHPISSARELNGRAKGESEATNRLSLSRQLCCHR
jgi:N-dimethylarginine dimethylaminohydrolase